MNQVTLDGFDNNYITFAPYIDNDKLRIYVFLLNDRVSIIKFEGKPIITVQHAIKLFDQPKRILVVHTNLYDQITLLNAQKGIAFGWQLYGGQSLENSEVSQETMITQLYFFDVNEYERVLNSTILSGGSLNSGDEIKNNLLPWNGYGSFKEKYWPPATP